jgi:outer membrane lipoprotein LolB
LKARILLTLFAALLVTAACAPLPTRTAEDQRSVQAFLQRSAQLQAVQRWQLDGRLAISDGKDGGSGNLSWLNDAGLTRMSFRGALGKGAWQLQSGAEGARLELANGTVHYASSLAELVLEQVGWKVPVEALAWWIKGMAYPARWESRAIDQSGRLTMLRQLGWEVDFAGYSDAAGYWLPTRLVARHDGYSVKMAVRKWQLGAGDERLE